MVGGQTLPLANEGRQLAHLPIAARQLAEQPPAHGVTGQTQDTGWCGRRVREGEGVHRLKLHQPRWIDQSRLVDHGSEASGVSAAGSRSRLRGFLAVRDASYPSESRRSAATQAAQLPRGPYGDRAVNEVWREMCDASGGTTMTTYLAQRARLRRSRSDPSEPGRASRPAWGLAALLGAMFLGNVDVAIANIAAPSVSTDLHTGGGELALVVSGYTLAYAVLLVTSSRLGEMRGYREMFLAGLGGFTVASLACGLAPSASALVIARFAAGAAAALMAAQVLTGIQLGFTGRARVRALGLYTLVLSAGAMAGQSLGGLLISADVLGLTWRPAFLVNVPAGVLLGWLAWRYLPSVERRPQTARLCRRSHLHRGDASPRAAAGTGARAGVAGLDRGIPGREHPRLRGAVGGGAEGPRGAGRPLIDPELVARPAIGWGLASQSACTATYFAVLFTLALYLQQGLGKSAAYSGLALVSWVTAFGVAGPLLDRVSARTRALAAPAGAVLLAAALMAWRAVRVGSAAGNNVPRGRNGGTDV
jgi:MFS family permease